MSLVVLKVKRRLEEESVPELRVSCKRTRLEQTPEKKDADDGGAGRASETVFRLAGSVAGDRLQPLCHQLKSVLPERFVSGAESVSTVLVANIVAGQRDDGNACFLCSKDVVHLPRSTPAPTQERGARAAVPFPQFPAELITCSQSRQPEHAAAPAPSRAASPTPILCNDRVMMRMRHNLRDFSLQDSGDQIDVDDRQYVYDFYVSQDHAVGHGRSPRSALTELSDGSDILDQAIAINDKDLLLFDFDHEEVDDGCRSGDSTSSDESNRTVDYPDEEEEECVGEEEEDSSSCFSDYS